MKARKVLWTSSYEAYNSRDPLDILTDREEIEIAQKRAKKILQNALRNYRKKNN